MKKRIISGLLIFCMLFLITACTQDPVHPAGETVQQQQPPQQQQQQDTEPPPVEEPPVDPNAPSFPGVIAIVTNTVDQNEEEYRSAAALVARYGEDRVIHRTWPVLFAQEAEMMITILSEIASIPEVNGIILNQAVVNSNAAIDAARGLRGDDIFIVSINAAETPADVSQRVDLALDINNPGIGELFVEQALLLGAETIVHYSFPRHMAVPHLAARRDRIAAAAAAGIPFHDLPTPDPMEEGGMGASQLYVSQAVPRHVAEFGVNTAFFSTNCGQQIPLLTQVLATGAIYVMPCDPSPFHAFPTALGLAGTQSEAMDTFSPQEMIDLTREAIAAAGMTGRISNWPFPASMLWTEVGFYYIVEWLNDRAPGGGGTPIDRNLINRLVGDYAERLYGERMYMELSYQTIDGIEYPLIVVGLAPFIIY